MTPTPIRTESANRLTRIVIDRPDKKNALTAAMYTALAEAIEQAEADPNCRVIVISGEGGFTAGNDLADFLDNPPRDESSPVFRFLAAISQAEKPIVAAVTGPAVGIGTTMLLHCDLIYAGPGSRFQLPFVNLGLCPEAASSYLLPLRLGQARAAELLLLGEPFGADKALEYGLVNAVYPNDEVLEQALTVAVKLAAKPAAAVRLTKQLLKQSSHPTVQQTIALEADYFRQQLDTPVAKEALQAFLERRAPDFSRFD